MGTSSEKSVPLAVELANERFQQQAMRAWLSEMRADGATLSDNVGGDLWLQLTNGALNRLKEESASDFSIEDILAGLRADLKQTCQLVLNRDQRQDGLVLKIYTERWYLIAKPATPAWLVIAVSPQGERSVHGYPMALSWRLLAPGQEAPKDVSPLPIWLLSRASVHHSCQVRIATPTLQRLDEPESKDIDPHLYSTISAQLPGALDELNSAFALLRWERNSRIRRSWKVELNATEDIPTAAQGTLYHVDCTESGKWRGQARRMVLGLEPFAARVWLAPDPDSPSAWLLDGPTGLSKTTTLYEVAEDDYRRQAAVVDRLGKSWKIEPKDVAVAATQINLESTGNNWATVGLLPGEAAWEPRQEQALQLAMAGHPICAIKGPPGTGKSTVIVGIIRRAIAQGKRVLFVAPTHVAIDEVLSRVHRLCETNIERNIFPARVAPANEQQAAIKAELQDYIARNLGKNLRYSSLAKIETEETIHTLSPRLIRGLVDCGIITTSLLGILNTFEGDLLNLRSTEETLSKRSEEWKSAQERSVELAALLIETQKRIEESDLEVVRTSKNNWVWEMAFSEHQKAKKHLDDLREQLQRLSEENSRIQDLIPQLQKNVKDADDLVSHAKKGVGNAETAFSEAIRRSEEQLQSSLTVLLTDVSSSKNAVRGVLRTLADYLASNPPLPDLNQEELIKRARALLEFNQSINDAVDSTNRRLELLRKWKTFFNQQESEKEVTDWARKAVNLVAATTQGIAGSWDFSKHYFDLMICDESSRVTRGEILVPADRAQQIVLVGDEKQLPPFVDTDDEQLIQALTIISLCESEPAELRRMADKLCDEWNVDEEEFRSVRADEVYERARQILQKGALPAWPLSVQGETLESERLRAWRRISDSITTSCFDHLLSFLPQEKSVRLNVQRRMVPEIATLVSKPVYGGDYENPKTSQIAPLITQSFRHPWVFLNTKGYCKIRHKGFRESSDGKTGFINEGEARAALVALKQHLLDSRRHGKKINGFMVITFYLSQADLIESLLLKDRDLRRERKNIAILPIDRCQGQEADVVIVSFVRTTLYPRPNAGRWLQDARRLNVAFTRARRSLILIGNLDTLTRLRGNADGERILAHLDHCIEKHRDHQLEQLYGL